MSQTNSQTALITGASTGIGLELAHIFARNGHPLILTARNAEKLNALAVDLREKYSVTVTVIPADLADPAAPQFLFDQIQSQSLTVNILVNNAGFGTHGKSWQIDPQQELSLIQVNITALVHLTRLFLPAMIQMRQGKVLNVASTAAFQPGPLMANYYASKAYVLSFSEALSNELQRTGVTATALCPGPTLTEFQIRAGIANSKLFQATGLTAAQVAHAGYHGLMAGRRVVIPGFKNRMLVMMNWFTPKSLVMKIVRMLNESR